MDQARKPWQPTPEELASILAEMQPIIRAFAKRDRERLRLDSDADPV